MLTLKGKNILVVGGSSGMGLATAQALAALGSEVTIASRSAENLAAATTVIDGEVVTRPLDGTNDAAVEAFFTDTPAWDHVVVSAGSGGRGRIDEFPIQDAFKAMNGKFWLYYRIARAAKVANDGSLTFVSGALSQKPAPGAALISAVNAAIEGLTRGLAIDLAPTRVNTVCPGLIDTPMWDRMPEADKLAMYARSAENLPAGRVGQPEDVAQTIIYLMTNQFSTGAVVPLEGGSFLT